MNLYLKSNRLLFADVFENLRKICFELELLTDIDMLLMVDKEIRGGIFHATH